MACSKNRFIFERQTFIITLFKEEKRLDKNQSKEIAGVSPVKPLSAIVALEEDIKMDQSRRRQIFKAQVKRSSKQEKGPGEENGGIKKEYPGSNSSCRVTLRLPKKAVGAAKRVTVAGEFNDWDRDTMPMKRLENGDFEISFALRTGRIYRFRYLIDNCRWENDWSADGYAPNPYGCDDSLLVL
jgi:hypothetical protein